MSTHAEPVPAALVAASSPAAGATKALVVGLIGLAVTALGLFADDLRNVAFSYLIGVSYWTAIAIGMLMMIMIHHIFDASWSVVIRRQWEHGLASFKWLLVLFLPLLIVTIVKPGAVWPWTDLNHVIHGTETVGQDPLYLKKSAFLSVKTLFGATVGFYLIWWWLSARLRKASFTQDSDGDPKWTLMNRVTSAAGIPLTALTLTAAAIYWIKSLEYHWFSTMYGVWFFANCVRGALCIGIVIMVWLHRRGEYRGVLNSNHYHSIGQLMLAFVVFWAYVTFSQYFLIWNANVPEETFWYNIREMNQDGHTNQWWWVGLAILFGHFVIPFLFLLSYRYKVTPVIIRRIAYGVLATILLDLCYNVLPALRDGHDNPQPFLSLRLFWVATSVVGVGGVCVWAYLRSFSTAKLIPIRDPRIGESLTHHE